MTLLNASVALVAPVMLRRAFEPLIAQRRGAGRHHVKAHVRSRRNCLVRRLRGDARRTTAGLTVSVAAALVTLPAELLTRTV